MAADMTVAQEAYRTAAAMGASPKVLLALFEAGWVESGWQNLNYGDRDSKGYLQQRPSQGWPNPNHVPTATQSFVSKAMNYDKLYPNLTAGQLAQKVQVSAFPAKYDQSEAQARQLLQQVGGTTAGGATGLTGTTPLGLPGSLGTDEIADKALTGAKEILIKLGAAGLGLALVGAGLVFAVLPGARRKADAVGRKLVTGGS